MIISSRAGIPAQNFSMLKNRANQQKQQKKVGFGKVEYEGLLKGLKHEDASSKLKAAMSSEVQAPKNSIEEIVTGALRRAKESADTFVIGLSKRLNATDLEVKHLNPDGKLVKFHSGPVGQLGKILHAD